MEYRKITDNQINLLEDAMNYNPSEDHTGAKGRSLADLLNIVFKGNLPKISTLTKKKIIQYNIIASENSLVLYNQMKKQKFKRIFGKLKKAGYKGPDGDSMKDYSKMSDIQMWNYFSQIREDLDIFS